MLRYFREQFRKRWGTWWIVDPRPIAASAPYTFFLPSEIELRELQIKDLVKLGFQSWPKSKTWDGERMWVEIVSIEKDEFYGTLANYPEDLPQLHPGKRIKFSSHHIIDFIRNSSACVAWDQVKPRQYWDRCLVENCVLYDGTLVGYLYREQPELLKNEAETKDSGWRIRGDSRWASEKELDERQTSFVALGAVLNRDDSWLHLIDEPVGSKFTRNFTSDKYNKSA
jgi:hypothetical protein